MKQVILVADFGTSNVRVNAVDIEDGSILYTHSMSYPMISPVSNFCELDAENMWENSVICMQSAVSQIKGKAEIRAVSFSFIGDCLIPVDKNGDVLHNLILCFDARGEEQARRIDEHFGMKWQMDNLFAPCGYYCTSAKILWIKENMPDIFRHAKYFDTIQQFVFRKLGLPAVNDETMAGRKLMYAYEKGIWAKELLDFIGISEEQLGSVVGTGDIVGSVKRYGTVEFETTVPVIAGGHDCDVGLLGTGATSYHPDILGEITGTYDHMGYIYNESLAGGQIDRQCRAGCGPLRGSYEVMDAFSTSGAAVNWFMKQLVGDTSPESFDFLWENVRFNGENPVSFFPRMDNNQGSICGIGLSTTKQNLFEALIESLTYEVRHMAEFCSRSRRQKFQTVRIGGGAAKSSQWNQLRADMTGMRYERLATCEVSSLGAAVLAAMSTGCYETEKEAIERMVQIRDIFEPRKEVYLKYDALYKKYLESR